MWLPTSWSNFYAKHQPEYCKGEELKKIKNELVNSLPIVLSEEIEKLHSELSNVVQGNAFVLHCGDCAESFNTTDNQIIDYLQLLGKMSRILHNMLGKSIIRISRIAGQFAKPRTDKFEHRNGITLPNYFGDMINSIHFDKKSRNHDPNNLLKAYNKSSVILNYIRAQLNFSKSSDFYTSHEALVLDYEESLTRKIKGVYYNLSSHYLWIGNKTRILGQAHLEYIRGINNPIAIKIDSEISIDDLLKIIEMVNPNNKKGKLTLISRMGVSKIDQYLPDLIYKIQNEGKSIIWSCDPMHGNTKLSSDGYKIRYISDIKSEVKKFFDINKSIGNIPGGIHLELTSQDVFECIYDDKDLQKMKKKYCTLCDPRLNSKQSIDLIKFISKELNKR